MRSAVISIRVRVIIYPQRGSCLLFSSGFITTGMWLSFHVFLLNWSSGVYYYLTSFLPLFSPSFLAGNRAGSRAALLSFILFFTFAVDSLTCGVPDRSLLRCLGFIPPKGATRKQLLVIAVLQIKVKIRGCINVFK